MRNEKSVDRVTLPRKSVALEYSQRRFLYSVYPLLEHRNREQRPTSSREKEAVAANETRGDRRGRCSRSLFSFLSSFPPLRLLSFPLSRLLAAC
eukprot:scaffold124638_cov33-Tisochrysis_lutea.AAC.5